MFRALQPTWQRNGDKAHFVLINSHQNAGELPLSFIQAHGDELGDYVYTIDQKDNCFSIKLRIAATRAYLGEGSSELIHFYDLRHNYGLKLQYVYHGIFYVEVVDEMLYHLHSRAEPGRNMRHILPRTLYNLVMTNYREFINENEAPIDPDYELFLQPGTPNLTDTSSDRPDSPPNPPTDPQPSSSSSNMELTTCLTHYEATKSQLTLPAHFSRQLLHYGNEGFWDIIVHNGQHIQQFSCKLLTSNQNQAKFGQGWMDLCTANGLKKNDVCTFNIVDGPSRLLHMFVNPGS